MNIFFHRGVETYHPREIVPVVGASLVSALFRVIFINHGLHRLLGFFMGE